MAYQPWATAKATFRLIDIPVCTGAEAWPFCQNGGQAPGQARTSWNWEKVVIEHSLRRGGQICLLFLHGRVGQNFCYAKHGQ